MIWRRKSPRRVRTKVNNYFVASISNFGTAASSRHGIHELLNNIYAKKMRDMGRGGGFDVDLTYVDDANRK